MTKANQRAGFERHAAPEAIRYYLRAAQRRAKDAAAEVNWLSGLLARREAEEAAGTWPGPAVDAT